MTDQELFRAIFDASPNAYMLLDRNFRFVAANDTYLRLTGTTRDTLLGRSLFDAFPHDPSDPHNENARLLRASLERVLATRSDDAIALIPYRVPRTPDGEVEERFWSATHRPILDEAGEVQFILQHTVDVTELHNDGAGDVREEFGVLQRARRVQEQHNVLDAERTHLRRLFEQAPGFAAVLAGPQHVFELVNNAYRRLIGGRDVTNRRVRDALPEVTGQGFFEALDAVYASGQPFVGRGMPVRLDRHAGAELEERYVDFVYQPIVDGSGTVVGIFVQGHDITPQKQLEAEREALLEQQRFLTAAIPQQVWTADAKGLLTSINQRVLEYFGVGEDEVLGARWAQFVHPEDIERVYARWLESLESGSEYEVEFRLRRADGVYRWHLGRAVIMRGHGPGASRWFGTNTDIDERKRVQDELMERAAYERQLIGIVSHDLRNPINAIGIAAALLIKQDQLNPLQAKAVARIDSAADRARRMIRDFLDFTLARAHGIPIKPGAANIRHIAQHVFDEVRVIYPEVRAELHHEGTEDVTWDADRIAQVIGNLLTNAFQHGGPDTSVQLRTRGTAETVAIEVQNDGPPIRSDDLARLFQPFERGDSTTSAERSVGLGLFISNEIVARHHGTLTVRSTQEEGTVFTVTLPRHVPGDATSPAATKSDRSS